MRTRVPCVVCALAVGVSLGSATLTHAQFSDQRSEPATGETYHVEFFGGLWDPSPEITLSSAQLGIPGSDIDVGGDLGILRKRFREFRLALRPARKHKFRLQYVPISYGSSVVLDRTLVFNGFRYDLGIPISAAAQWNTWRIGYEYDVVYRDRWFVGLILEAKYTDVDVSLNSPFASEFTRARAPVPAIGGIVRAYPLRRWGLTFELTGFKLPEQIDDNYRAEYLDIDVYTTLNATDHVGFQFGFRSIDALYRVRADAGSVKLKGPYVGGLLRF